METQFQRLECLHSDEAGRLELPFSGEEVFIDLPDLGKDKAPSPDGYTMAFWIFNWESLKEKLIVFPVSSIRGTNVSSP